MEEFSISASVVQWLTTGYLLLLSVSIPSSPFMVRKFATKTLFIMAIAIFTAGTVLGALALLPGAVLGARLVSRVPERTLRFIFFGLLAVAAVVLVVNEFGLL